MKSKPIKSTKSKTTTNPETVISIEQDMIKFQIQINKLKNKILESQRKLLALNEKGSFFDGCNFEDFPDK